MQHPQGVSHRVAILAGRNYSIETHLLIETSDRGGCVGLVRDGVAVQSLGLDESQRHARDLAGKVRAILAAEKLKPAEIAGVLVSLGPGSFTGLRVGLVSAKAFAFALGCPLVAVPTFHAIAERVTMNVDSVEVIADGLQGLVYAQRFSRVETAWQPANELRILTAIDWSSTLAELDTVTGPGVAIYSSIIPCKMLAEELRRPSIESLWLAGRKLKPLSREELFAVEPLYLRGSSAEEKRKAQSASASMAS